MDGGATVTALTGADAAQVERAVFTSIRSPMGVGYRIVAASSGISADEKREILRCAPSHGSLCDPSPDATGLASFTMNSGRQCLLLSRHAGVEQTARGGYRVHTHVLVIDPELFARLSWDPFEVEGAALVEIGERLSEIPSARLEPLSLRPRNNPFSEHHYSAAKSPEGRDGDLLAGAVSAILERRPTLIVGTPTPRDVLRWMLQATPGARRRDLSVSYGLKFSPTRRFECILADATSPEIKRIAQDHAFNVIHWNAPPAPTGACFREWLRFVRGRCAAGRFRDVARLSADIVQDCSSETLASVVGLLDDIERAPTGGVPQLDELTQRYSHAVYTEPAARGLLIELRTAVASRRAELVEAEQDAEEQPVASAPNRAE